MLIEALEPVRLRLIRPMQLGLRRGKRVILDAVVRPEQARLSAPPPGPCERNLIKLAFLAPDLQQAILEGRQPAGLTLQALIEADLPPAWADQRTWAEALE